MIKNDENKLFFKDGFRIPLKLHPSDVPLDIKYEVSIGKAKNISFVPGIIVIHPKKVFLGGTCNDSIWRNKLIKMLDIDYFNPVVDDWNEEAQKRELEEREKADYLLYVITPKMTGVYSIAEVIDDSNKRPERTIFCFLKEDDNQKFDNGQIKSLNAVGKMIRRNGSLWLSSLIEIAEFLNNSSAVGSI